MAMLNRPFPGKLHIMVTGAGASAAPGGQKTNFGSAKDINRSFPAMKYASTRAAFTKDFAGLTVTVVPELTNTCIPGLGVPNGISDVFIARGVSLGLEIIRELIPDDTAMVLPQVAAVTAWGIAKVVELALDLVHAQYLECNAKKDGDALADNLKTANDNLTSVKSTVTTINTTVGGINTHTDSVKDAILTKINTLDGKANTTNNAISTVGGNVTTINNTVNNISTKLNTVSTNVNTVSTKVDNVNTNMDNSRTLIINNANLTAANTLRLLIEADLATPDSSTPLAIFETPALKGGYLELVRSIVFETIKNLTGATTARANATLASADALLASGKYKAAYSAYRKAYKSAAN